jgi:hypothetical protein
MPGDRNLVSLDASLAIPTRVLRFEDSGLRRRTPVRPVLPTGQTVKDRFGRPERGGSEWEPIKILPFG